MIPRSATRGNVPRFSSQARALSALLAAVGLAAFGVGCDIKAVDDATAAGGSSGELTPGSKGAWKSACSSRADCLEENAACLTGLTGTGGGTNGVCTGPLARRAFLAECAGYAEGAAAVCSGLACQALTPNAQGKAGICTLAGCTRDSDCGAGAICFAQGLATLCLATCASSDDCAGFACVTATSTTNVCLVQ
jgi:hypothetical protein